MIHPTIRPDRAAVADHYDSLDGFYREVWGEHVHHGLWRTGREPSDVAVRQLVEHLAGKIGLRPGDAVVDVGCGYGATARQLAAEFGATVTGLTVSTAQHAHAVGVTPGDNPAYLLRDWLENELPAESFDRAVAIESTEHMADKARVFAEMHRVLRPGGTLGVYAWIAKEGAKAWEVRHLLEPICREGRLAGMGTETDYRLLLAAAGFTDIGVEDLSKSVRQTWRHCVTRLAAGLVREPRYRRYLLDPRNRNRIFLASVVRIWAAYHLGTMRYLLFTARRPSGNDQ
jgi:tocopherol O-methyltransferase